MHGCGIDIKWTELPFAFGDVPGSRQKVVMQYGRIESPKSDDNQRQLHLWLALSDTRRYDELYAVKLDVSLENLLVPCFYKATLFGLRKQLWILVCFELIDLRAVCSTLDRTSWLLRMLSGKPIGWVALEAAYAACRETAQRPWCM